MHRECPWWQVAAWGCVRPHLVAVTRRGCCARPPVGMCRGAQSLATCLPAVAAPPADAVGGRSLRPSARATRSSGVCRRHGRGTHLARPHGSPEPRGPPRAPLAALPHPSSIPHCSAYGDQTRAPPSWAPCRGPCHHQPGSLCRSPGQAARPGSPRTPLSSARSTRHLPVSVRLFQMGTWRVAKFRLRWTLVGSSFVSLGWAPQQVPETWHRRCPSTGAGLSGVGPPSHPTGGADSPAAPHRQPRLALPPPPPRVGGGGLRWHRAQGLAHPGGCAHGAATYLSRPPAHLLLDCLFFLDLREFFKHSGRRSFVRGFHTFWQFIRSAEVFILAKLNSSIFSRTGNAILHWETLAHPQASVRSCRTFWKV